MKLQRALRLERGQILSFVGAGGKTSALHRLAAELAQTTPVLLTTTTKVGQEQFKSTSPHLIDDGDQDLDWLADILKTNNRVLWTGPAIPEESKWSGIAPGRIDAFKRHAERMGAIVLVEADGARQSFIKAPGDHEPVIPEASDLVVPIVGLEALGRSLDQRVAHRPYRIAQILSVDLGANLTEEDLVRLVSSEDGGLKGIPSTAEVRVLLNQWPETKPSAAQAIAEGCLAASERIEAVLAANLMADNPVDRVVGRIAGVVLAAGSASRMGELKQVREWQGEPMVKRMVEAAQQAGLEPVIVVSGHQGHRVAEAVAPTGVALINNPDWEAGQSSSMRLGLDQVEAGSEGTVFMLADMPLVKAEHIASLVEAHQSSLADVVAPRAEGRYGNPVLFDRRAYPALRQVEGDKGGRAVFDRFEIEAVPAGRWALEDVDTEADWDQLDR